MADKKINFRYIFFTFIAFLLGLYMARNLFAGKIDYFILAIALAIFVSVVFAIRKLWKPILLLFAFFLIGNGFYFLGIQDFAVKDYQGQVSIVGRVSDDIMEYDYSCNILLKDVKINGEKSKNITLNVTSLSGEIKAGDIFAFEGEVEKIKPFTLGKFNSHYYRNDIRYSCSVKFDKIVVTEGYLKFDESVRLSIKSLLHENMSKDNADTAYAVMFGDKNALNDEIYSAYKMSGTIHVLTVSGLHVGFLIALINIFLKLCRANKYLSFVLSTIIIIFYAYLCGFSPSVLRASVMGIVLMASKLLYKRYDPLNSVGLAGFILCLIKPLYALDVGFLMSLFCVSSIFVLFPVINNLLKKVFPEKVSSLISLSFCAQIGILPMLCITRGSVNLLSFMANIIVVPLFSLIFPILFVLCFIGILLPFMGIFLAPIDWAFSGILGIIKFFAGSGLIINLRETHLPLTIIFYSLIFAISQFYMTERKEKFLIFSSFILIMVVLGGGYMFLPKQDDIVFLSSYDKEAVILTSSSGQTLQVGECYLAQRYTTNSRLKINARVVLGKVTYEEIKDFDVISKDSLPIVEGEMIAGEGDFAFGDFVITYLEGGVRINFDEKEIFIANESEFDYNKFVEANQTYNFDIAICNTPFEEEGLLVAGGNGNFALKFNNGWAIRELD